MADGICFGCSSNTLADCIACFKAGSCHCNHYNVIKELLERATMNYTAADDPDADNDETEGYKFGDAWYATTSGKWFKCSDASEGAAVWDQLN